MNIQPTLTGTAGQGMVAGRSTLTRFSVLLPLLLLLTLPGLALAQFQYIVDDGTVTITGYTGSGGDVVIPDKINGSVVTAIGSSAFYSKAKLTRVTMGSGVTSIGDFAFGHCANLNSITIGNGVINIGDYAFYNCPSLASFAIPGSVTSLGEEFLFYGCRSLAAISVDPSNQVYASLDGVLFSRDGTRLIRFPLAKAGSYTIPESVTTISERAFSDSSGLTSVVIPESVTSIGAGAFVRCVSLKNVTIPDSVTSLGSATFYGCTGLTNVAIGNNVTSMDELVFAYCSSLTSVTIPDSARTIGYSAFESCTSMTRLLIGTSVTTIATSAFGGCSSLTSVTIPANVDNIERMVFNGCSSLLAITVDPLNSVYSSQNEVLFSKIRDALIRCPEGKAGNYTIPDSVTSIAAGAFSRCTRLSSVTIPDSVTSIGGTAFLRCTGMRSITIPDSVTNIGGQAFRDCLYLINMTIPNSVTSIGEAAFWGCINLSSVTISDRLSNIARNLFEDCISLATVTIPESVTSIGASAFLDCTRLISVKIGNRVSSIGYGAFRGCTSLTSAYFEGDAPVLGDQGEYDDTVFYDTSATIYYLPGTLGWDPTFGGRPTMPWGVVWGSPVRGDANGDEVVDRNDLDLVVASRNQPAVDSEDPRDLDGDGLITVLDARILVTLFSVPGGLLRAAASTEGVVLDWAQSAGAVKLQSTTDLQRGTWQDVDAGQSSTNAVIDTAGERMFFRLVLPE